MQRIVGRMRGAAAPALPPDALCAMEQLSEHLGREPGFCRDLVMARGSFRALLQELSQRAGEEASALLLRMEEAMSDEWHRVRSRIPDRQSPRVRDPPRRPCAPAPPCLKRSDSSSLDSTSSSDSGRRAKRLRIQCPVMCGAFPHLMWMMSKTDREVPETFSEIVPSPRTIIDRLHSSLSCPLRFSALLRRAPAFIFEMIDYYSSLFAATRSPVIGAIVIRAVFLTMHMNCRSTAPYPVNMHSWFNMALSNTSDCRALWLLFDAVRSDPSVSASRSARGMCIVRHFISRDRGKSLLYKIFERSTGILVGDVLPATCSEERLHVWICDMTEFLDARLRGARARKNSDISAVVDVICGCSDLVLCDAFALARYSADADESQSARSHFSTGD
jgi:hypothetical protein